MDCVEQTIRMNSLSKELRKYGFAQSSQEAISQAGAIYGANTEEINAQIEVAQLSKAQFDEIISKMQKLWVFKEGTNQKINLLAEQLIKVTEKLNELIKTISLIEMNQAVFDKKLNCLRENPAPARESPRESSRESYSNVQEDRHVEESSAREKERKLDKPIDRNGVAPASVAIDKIFYCGNK